MRAKFLEVFVGAVAVVLVWGSGLHLCRTLITSAVAEVVSYTTTIK